MYMLFRIAVELRWVSEKMNLLYLPDSVLNNKNMTKDKTRASMQQREYGAGQISYVAISEIMGTTLDEECDISELHCGVFVVWFEDALEGKLVRRLLKGTGPLSQAIGASSLYSLA